MKSVARKVVLGCISAGFLSLVTETPAASSFTFSNTSFITINDFPAVATPYPSSIIVTNLTDLVVTKVTLQLVGLSHSFPDDIDMLLVSPAGQNTTFFSNVGGNCVISNILITLDDNSLFPLTNNCLLSGVFHPTNRLAGDPFPSPAPIPSGASDFSVFKGTDPNGSWRLYVADDTFPDSGSISGGWSITIFVSAPLQIQLLQTNVVTSWPAAAKDWILQSTPSLTAPAIWSNILSPAPVEVSGRLTVTNVLSSGNMFYRLVQF